MTRVTNAVELVERTSAEAVRLMHTRDRFIGDTSEGAYAARVHLAGEIQGLRWVLCLMKGWAPLYESAQHGEKADLYLRVWHNLPGHCDRKGCGKW